MIAMAAAIALFGCAPEPIAVKEFEGYSIIEEGEQAKLKWEFENADIVIVEGIRDTLNPVDSLVVSPSASTAYFITAKRGETNMWRQNWNVEVIPKKEDIKTGPEFLEEEIYETSFDYSRYFTGIQPGNANIEPAYLKIMQLKYPTSGDEKFIAKAIILDEFGNYIQDYSIIKPGLTWSAIHYCKSGTVGSPIPEFDEKEFVMPGAPVNISVLLDNSPAADNNYLAFDHIKDYVNRLNPADQLSVAYFNHLYQPVIQQSHAGRAALLLHDREIPEPSGLTGMYRAGYNALRDMSTDGVQESNLLIIITFSQDNASLIYDAADVAKLAREMDVPVYVIAVGSAINSYSLKFLTGYTGGRYYNVLDEDVQDIYPIIREIVFAQRANYQVNIAPKDADFEKCRISKSEISAIAGSNVISDNINIYRDPIPQYSQYQAVAAFGYRDTTVADEFIPLIESLGRTLEDNPTFDVELIGHSSIEGNSELNMMFSIKRAESVKRQLVDMGISPERIYVRGEGANKPIYYLQQIPWQQYYNRRVEIRWLDPSQKPFEIIAEKEWTETAALREVEKWEAKGFNAYYERYLKNNIPIYRVKLWGYSTIEEARDKATTLGKQYDIDFEVE